MSSIYNSRDIWYKTPYGAVPTGTVIKLRISPPKELYTSAARLCAYFEQSEAYYEIEMPRLPSECGGGGKGGGNCRGDCDVFETHVETGSYSGLIWYFFRIECREGVRYVTNTGMSETGGHSMQITVYRPEFSKTHWFSEGIIYQIFPDRFCRTEVPAAPARKRVHENWDEPPHFRPDTDPNTGRDLWNNDFYGGNLAGIITKLDYLANLGITIIYLNPIFEAFSNHRYDTASYETIDPLLGDNHMFSEFCKLCHKRGIRVVLDGVFSHTGADSVYFNQEGTYGNLGASQSVDSPYYSWFDFQSFPDKYSAWWGIKTLPAVKELESSYMDFIIRGNHSIVRRWLRMGADGWRLDVADELPDEFIGQLTKAAREVKPDSVVIGEVWEDASNKMAYDLRRKHFFGGYLDGVMNYPFRQSVISFLLGGSSGDFIEQMEILRENYPREAFYNSMNFLGTHDTMRIINVLAGISCPDTREEQARFSMSDTQYELGKSRLKLAAIILFTFPGVPAIYYGDEVGVCGFTDPFNRTTYPWGKEDIALLDWYRRLCRIRTELAPLKRGDINYLLSQDDVLIYSRTQGHETVYTIINSGGQGAEIRLPWSHRTAIDAITGEKLRAADGHLTLNLPPRSGSVISEKHFRLTQ